MNKDPADPPDWRQYELAVAAFVSAVGGGAKVTHDAKLPDAHTGLPRQRDVWVEWSLGNHFPVKALISCKYWRAALDQSDIDHFNGEFISSRAQVGIIYSRSGFNEAAIKKAQLLGFHCCRLLQNQPPDVPEMLSLGLAYHFRPQIRCSVRGDLPSYGFSHWKQVLALPIGESTVLSELAHHYRAFNETSDHQAKWQHARNGFRAMVQVRNSGTAPIDVTLHVRYTAYQAKIEYTLLNGSYNVSSKAFKGSETSPWIDLKSIHPGPGWAVIQSLPDEIPRPLIAAFANADPAQHLREFGEDELPM